jgi:hypothetical protein
VSLADLGKLLIGFGVLLVVIGAVLMLAGRLPWLGRLPGDIYIQRGHWTFYFPLATSIIVSLLLTLAFWLINRR